MSDYPEQEKLWCVFNCHTDMIVGKANNSNSAVRYTWSRRKDAENWLKDSGLAVSRHIIFEINPALILEAAIQTNDAANALASLSPVSGGDADVSVET